MTRKFGKCRWSTARVISFIPGSIRRTSWSIASLDLVSDPSRVTSSVRLALASRCLAENTLYLWLTLNLRFEHRSIHTAGLPCRAPRQEHRADAKCKPAMIMWMVQRVFWGPVDIRANEAIPDINVREIFVVAPLVVLVVWIGVHPNTFLEPMEASVRLLLGR